MSTPLNITPELTDLDAQLQYLRAQRDRDRRALDVLYHVSVACRGVATDQAIFEVLGRELQAVFPLDSYYIALCDLTHPEIFRTALLYDEGLVEYAEHVDFGPISGQLIHERIPILIPDLNVLRDTLNQHPTTFGNTQKLSRAWMGVPLLLGNDALGVISLQSYTPAIFSDADLDLLQRIGQVVAVALENANLIQQQRRLGNELATRVAARTQELAALEAIAAETVLQQPLPELLDRALALIVPLLEMKAGNVRLYDRERDALVLIAQRHVPQNDPRAVEALPVSGTRLGSIVRDNKPLMIERDLAQHALLKTPSIFDSLLGVPLRIGDQVVGSMVLLDVQPRTFDQQQIDLMQLIGNQLAIAVENARLLEERERQIQELRALGAISESANTSLNLRMLLREVYEALHGMMPLDAFVMSIYDAQRDVMVEGFGIDEGETYEYYTHNEPLIPGSFTAWIIRNRQMLHLRNVAERANYPELSGVLAGSGRPAASWLGVPLYAHDKQVIGTIVVQSYTPNAFDERNERFVQNVAQQAALHVRNVALLAQRERQIRELDAIGRIGQLVSATFDLDNMLQIVYEILQQVTSAAAFYMVVCEPVSHIVTQAFYIERGVRFTDDWPGTAPPPHTLTGWILHERRSLRFDNLSAERERLIQLGITPVFMDNTVQPRAWVGVPLLAEDSEPIGVISVQDEVAGRYDAQTEEFLNQVASHLSLGVQKIKLFGERERQISANAQLFAEAQAHAATAERQAQRMALIHRISLLLNSRIDPQEILDRAAEELAKLFGLNHVGIMLIEESDETGVIVAEYPHGELLNYRVPAVALNHLQRAVESRRPLIIESVADSAMPEAVRSMLLQGNIVSVMLAPLVSRNRIIGSIGLDSVGQQRSFSDEEQESFMTITTTVATAFENARLFAAEHAARQTADTLREVGRMLSSTFDANEVLNLILDQLHKVIVYDSASIMLVDGDSLHTVAQRGLDNDQSSRLRAFSVGERSGAGLVVKQRQPVAIDDTLASSDWRNFEFGMDIRSWLGVPLIAKGKVLGVLNIDSHRPHHFTERDVEVALAFANQAAVALENAQLYQESVTRVEQELEIARRIQSNLFPRELPRVPGITIAARAIPARETGGDFYDVVPLGAERFGLLIGDASGKSIPAAMLMAVARSTARSEARDHELPETVMRETNRLVALDVPPHSFVALSYATLDASSRRLALANAGQLSPLRRRADGTVEYLDVPGPKLPLGIQPETAYAALEVALERGDLLVFYTDGIVEAHNPRRELFGFERLEAIVREMGDLTPEELIDTVLAAVDIFSYRMSQHDDMTLLVLRVE